MLVHFVVAFKMASHTALVKSSSSFSHEKNKVDKAVNSSYPLWNAIQHLIELALIAIHLLIEPKGLLLPRAPNDFHVLWGRS